MDFSYTSKTCEDIVTFCNGTCEMRDAVTFQGNNGSIRKTRIGWTEDHKLQEKMKRFLLEANRNAFGFNADYLPPLQFGEYHPGGHYDWHHDVNWNNEGMYDRKLSIVLQLSDPATYSGGDFEFSEVQNPNFRPQGSVLVFPSYLLHRVTPVISGVRHSLVGWVEGPRWK